MELEVNFANIVEKSSSIIINSIEGSDERCHLLTEVAQLNHYRWMYGAIASLPNVKLYGSANLRDARAIVYPCNRFKCRVRCPCYTCHGLRATQTDIELLENHNRYHHALHLPCNYCGETVLSDQTKLYQKKNIPSGKWKFSHDSYENKLSRGKVYKDYMWKKDFGDKEDLTSDEYFSKRDKKVLAYKCVQCNITFKHPGHKKRHFESVHYSKSMSVKNVRCCFPVQTTLNAIKKCITLKKMMTMTLQQKIHLIQILVKMNVKTSPTKMTLMTQCIQVMLTVIIMKKVSKVTFLNMILHHVMIVKSHLRMNHAVVKYQRKRGNFNANSVRKFFQPIGI